MPYTGNEVFSSQLGIVVPKILPIEGQHKYREIFTEYDG